MRGRNRREVLDRLLKYSTGRFLWPAVCGILLCVVSRASAQGADSGGRWGNDGDARTAGAAGTESSDPEKEKLFARLIASFNGLPGETIARTGFQRRPGLTTQAEKDEWLKKNEDVISQHKDNPLEATQWSVGRAVGNILHHARGRSDGREIRLRMLDELRGSALEGLAAMILVDEAGATPDSRDKLDLYRKTVEWYGDDSTPVVQSCVAAAAKGIAVLDGDSAASARLCRSVALRLVGNRFETIPQDVNELLFVCAEKLGDKDDRAFFWDLFIRRYTLDNGCAPSFLSLKDALWGQGRATGNSAGAALFFARWLESADSEDALFRALMAMSKYRDEALSKEGRHELVRRFAETEDAKKALAVLKILNNDDETCSDYPGDRRMLYAEIAERFSSAEDPEGLTVHARALLGQAKASPDTDEGIRLCQKIIGETSARDARLLYRELEEARSLVKRLGGKYSK